MKLRIPKLTWEQKVDKLRRIVLSGASIEEAPQNVQLMLETWRSHQHGKITDEEYMQTASQRLGPAQEQDRLIWEPFSNERGDEKPLFGWWLHATLLGINGQPWWLVKAWRIDAQPVTPEMRATIEKAVGLLGCHDVRRDLIREFPDEEERLTLFWSWFHTGKLLEIHFRKKPYDMLVVDEGTPVKAGYERMPRISRKDPSPPTIAMPNYRS